MKKNWKNGYTGIGIGVIIFLFMLGMAEGSYAQDRSIQFEKGNTWKKQLNQARKEKKLIFVDCYTKWCGFCKILDQYIFTDQQVADFYNQHFINVRMDMEEGIGPELRKKFGVMTYPTLLFVNTEGELVDGSVGYITNVDLIKLGERALNPEKNLAGLQKKYEAGNHTPALLKDYLRILNKAGKDHLCEGIIVNCISKLQDDDFYTTGVWEVLAENSSPALPLMMERVVSKRGRFDELVGKEKVDEVLDKDFTSKSEQLMNASRRKNFNVEEGLRIREFLLAQDVLPHAAEYIAAMYVAEYLNKQEYEKVLEVLKETLKYNFYRKDTQDRFLNFSLRYMADIENMDLRKEGVAILDAFRPGMVREQKKPMYDATRNMLLGIDKD